MRGLGLPSGRATPSAGDDERRPIARGQERRCGRAGPEPLVDGTDRKGRPPEDRRLAGGGRGAARGPLPRQDAAGDPRGAAAETGARGTGHGPAATRRERGGPVLTRPFLIDTDTASDDAVALLMALRHPGVSVEAITVVAGNVPLDQAVQNALYTVELCGARTPVHPGAEAPLGRPLETAQLVHGRDGMGDLGLPLRGREAAKGDAVDVILEIASRHAGSLTLVTLGPLTNVARALEREPRLGERVSRCVVMGGTGSGPGNVTPLAEYNLWVDPEAAQVVFESALPLTLVGWDISCASAVIDPATAAGLRAIGSERARFAIDIQRQVDEYARRVSGLAGFDLPDPVAMAVALVPGLARTERRRLRVASGGDERGATLPAPTGRGGELEVVTHVPRQGFLSLLEDALR